MIGSRGRAALGVAVTAALMALPGRAPEPAGCGAPALDGAAARGALLAIRCDGEGAPLRGAELLLFGRALDVNRADARALEALPGIGPRRAEAIVRSRATAPFCSLRELVRVPGLGPGTVARLVPHATVGLAPGCARS